ncbi:hypothetical protein Pfo_000740 [Paulownia fortunei]|nr:hypothetical protein Pfo_000740 [Paulownia fortunei]
MEKHDLKMILDHPKIRGEKTVQSAITEVAAMMGENVKLGGGFAISAPTYGVLSAHISIQVPNQDKDARLDAVQSVGSELAMHVVAAMPLFLKKEHVSSDALGNECEILRSQAESTVKSQMAVDKMVEGRLRKYFEEVVLLEQKFVVDDTVNIKTVLNNLSKEAGSTVKIGNFLRVEVGGGHKRPEASSRTEPLAQATQNVVICPSEKIEMLFNSRILSQRIFCLVCMYDLLASEEIKPLMHIVGSELRSTAELILCMPSICSLGSSGWRTFSLLSIY